MKKINACKNSILVNLGGGFLVFIATWFCLDISGLVNKIIILFQLSNNIKQYVILIDFLIKIIICLILLLLYTLVYILLFEVGNTVKNKYYATDIVEYIKRNKIQLSKVIVFGYSLSFIEPLRDFLYEQSLPDVEVYLVVPTSEYIEQNLKEDKPISTRIEVQNGRIMQWEKLKNENRIKKLNVKRYPTLPTEYGVLLNDEILFIYYFIWEYDNLKYKLVKTPLENRKMIKLIKKKNMHLFKYYYYKLKLALHGE